MQAEADSGVGEAVHTVLDLAGMIPLFGAIPDLINAGIYAAEGDYGNAVLSAGAAIPLVGDVAGAGKIALKYGDDVIGLASHAGDELATAGAKGIDILSGAGAKSGDDLLGAACSFAAATLVRTTRGDVPIGEVDVGDAVIASDEASGTTAAYPVSAVWSHQDPLTGTVEIDGEAIEVTPDHPFRTVERGWVAAGELRPGERIVSLEGAPGTVTAIRWDGGPAEMRNLTVAVAHTYTVGTGGWLVHNACGPSGRDTWGNPDTLEDHFKRRGADVGATTADEYASAASEFLVSSQRSGLPTLIEPKSGVIRIYDPKRNLFGSYNPSGTTRTLFTPSSKTYFPKPKWGGPPTILGGG